MNVGGWSSLSGPTATGEDSASGGEAPDEVDCGDGSGLNANSFFFLGERGAKPCQVIGC